MKVSIIVLSYNHASYLRENLQSLTEQKTNFEYEILVGDDCSHDNSRLIIDQFYGEHPNKIKRIYPETNLGPNANYLNCLENARGQYIAFCEGDDYWIDEHKLQKQIDFLEQNPKYGGVSTNNRWFLENENVFNDSVMEEGEITFESLGESNKINSQTMLFKKELIENLDWIKDLKIGDWALNLYITSQQPYYRLPDITTVYRVHKGGVHSLLKEESKIRNRAAVLIAVLENIELTAERKDFIKQSIRTLLVKLIGYNAKDINTTRKQYFNYGGTVFNKTLLKSYIK